MDGWIDRWKGDDEIALHRTRYYCCMKGNCTSRLNGMDRRSFPQHHPMYIPCAPLGCAVGSLHKTKYLFILVLDPTDFSSLVKQQQ
mmetsp:Transcript_528/g.824  ORF Transcript_528/g.824 Transcript_528/m.824 type:complete len:86 (-) Transcript_528:35-292(-)